ncbi:MAG: geranylgeranylglyceryl/heptaprenylglyceryl phosphate synthase [Saprospiraceae bacterium]|nr:geranylgeranylglyceryl/heptaprenylglyceryl phosphate synthase [Saprospiraceae bacterium]
MLKNKGIYHNHCHAKAQGEKQIAVLLDPDKIPPAHISRHIEVALLAKVDYFLIGGSTSLRGSLDDLIDNLRRETDTPLILFPGSPLQICKKADAILFLSLISGRNPELLIGHHVISAPTLMQSGIEVISTGYMLIDGGMRTAVQYMSNTQPIPADKNDIAVGTAMAGQLLGLKLLYLEAGSGAKNPVSESIIRDVSQSVSIPIITGGGIRTPEKALENFRAGADLIVVGNALENDPGLIREIAAARFAT